PCPPGRQQPPAQPEPRHPHAHRGHQRRHAATSGLLHTPGGTLFSTTPGGTGIIDDRKFLLDRRNSPMAQTPPCHLPNIPGVTSPGTLIEDSKVEVNNLNNLNNPDSKHAVGDEAQFEMDT
ncbi:Eukaryotic translation initiation factor 4E-binding protein 2, partial [Lemmus lemmus]